MTCNCKLPRYSCCTSLPFKQTLTLKKAVVINYLRKLPNIGFVVRFNALFLTPLVWASMEVAMISQRTCRLRLDHM
jgi:hypothetical protein